METNYQAIVVGGGVVGVSIAYHLALKSLKDVLLLERDEPVSYTHLTLPTILLV